MLATWTSYVSGHLHHHAIARAVNHAWRGRCGPEIPPTLPPPPEGELRRARMQAAEIPPSPETCRAHARAATAATRAVEVGVH